MLNQLETTPTAGEMAMLDAVFNFLLHGSSLVFFVAGLKSGVRSDLLCSHNDIGGPDGMYSPITSAIPLSHVSSRAKLYFWPWLNADPAPATITHVLTCAPKAQP